MMAAQRIPILSPWFEVRCYDIRNREAEPAAWFLDETARDRFIYHTRPQLPHHLIFYRRLTHEQARLLRLDQ